MTTLALSMNTPASPKRSYDDAGLRNDFLPDSSTGDSYVSQPFLGLDVADQNPIQRGPLPSTENENLISASVAPSSAPSAAAEKPAKRVKLSSDEKEVKKIEKAVKDRLRAEEKARKEDEKAKKDAERAVKEEERRKVKEAKEEQARIKEEEKQKKEDERLKKARSQLRLNAFFQQPTNSTGDRERSPTKSPTKPQCSPLSSRRSSIAEINAIEVEQLSRSTSVQATPSKPRMSDYKRHFPTFFVQSHTTIAPQNRLCRIPRDLQPDTETIDQLLSQQDQHTQQFSTNVIRDLWHLPLKRRRNLRGPVSLKEIIRKMNGSSNNPIDLTANPDDMGSTIVSNDVPVKFLKFAEDVRPPYIGTYSKTPKQGSLESLAKKPFSRVRPDTNYDWDSEAEWEDVVDGEDLQSEGEEEEEDEDEDEMAGFLDDEDTNAVKRRPLLGDQEPQCSGICWEGQVFSSNGKPISSLTSYRMDILLENSCLPIDPFSTIYWSPKSSAPNSSTGSQSNQQTLMEPPRIPLSPVNRSNTLLKPPSLPATANSGANKPPKRFIDPEIMDEFKLAVVGSNLTKMGLCEILKVKFPKQKKDAIKDTLEALAERVGAKAAEKRWVLKGS